MVSALIVASAWLLMRYFEDFEKSAFFGETWWLVKRICPLLLVGTFITGVIGYSLLVELISSIFGRSDFLACFIAWS